MMWKQGPRKSKDGTNEWEIALDKQSKAARNDEQPENAKSKKRTVLIAFGVLLALCLAVGMVNCAASYEQTESVKNPSPEQVNKNAKANPNADKDKADEESQKAEGNVTDEASGGNADTSKPETGGNSTSSGNGGSTGNGGNSGSNGGGGSTNGDGGSKPQHVHNWVPQTTVVHHEAQVQTVHHDAVYGTGVECNGCFAQFNSYEAWLAHSDSQFEIEGFDTQCAGYHTIKIVLEQAWDETIEVSPAWDETVTTGYSCSCGAVK